MITKIVLVRHGETDKNLGGKIHKDKDQTGLNSSGIKQVEKAAKKLKLLGPTTIYSSREKRAIQSAEIIAKPCEIKPVVVDGLQERNWGNFAGKSWPEIQAVLDQMTLDERFNYVPPNGESWKEFDARLRENLDRIISENKGGTFVLVTHGGAIRALMPYLLGLPKEESFKYDPDNASITIFDFDGKLFTKQIVNDTSHLT